jgi:hypothetical protein
VKPGHRQINFKIKCEKAAVWQPFCYYTLVKLTKMRSTRQLLFFVFLIIFWSESIRAQIPVTGTDVIVEKLRLNSAIEGRDNITYSDIQGDPYIFKDFKRGILHIEPDIKYNVDIRYDIYADQIHLKENNQVYAIIHPEKVNLIEAGSYKFIYSYYAKSTKDNEAAKSAYFILLVDGKCRLLKKMNIRVQDAEPAKLYQDAKPAKFIPTSDTYFLKPGDKNAVKIRSKADLLTVLSDKTDELDSYISSNKLDVKKDDDLIKIISYYNSK